MVGGSHEVLRDMFAEMRRTWFSGIVLGATMGALAPPALAASSNKDCDPQADDQQSVVVSTEKAEPGAAVEPPAPGALEPIANVSEYEPELAEPREPTVAPESAPTDIPAAPPSSQAELVEPSSFFGATPGLTTRQELLDSWGAPADGDPEAVTIIYRLKSFPEVTVGFAGDVVDTIVVVLPQPRTTEELIEKLQLGEFQPLATMDDNGNPTATSFPERGVTLRHDDFSGLAVASDNEQAASGKTVTGLDLHAISARDFVERARRQPAHLLTNREADLEIAVDLQHDHAEAKFLLSQVALSSSRPVLGEKYAAEAVEADEENRAYRLQWVKALTALARYDEAVDQCRQVLEGLSAASLVRAEALHQMGLLASFGGIEVAKRSVPLHNKAIAMADALATDPDPAVAAAATKLLVDAHLAVAKGIAEGQWSDKDEYVGQWISRASSLAEQLIEKDDRYLPLRLHVAVSALAAGSRLQPPIDPQLWVVEAEETVTALAPLAGDAAMRAEFNWQLGLAYSYATEIQHRRGQAASALRYGDLAEVQLSELVARRDEMPDANFVAGRLFFQIGAVHAVHREDHEAACTWYDRASQMLLTPVPVTNNSAPGRHGDALVSMGVSYWHVGQREKAVELTQTGLEFVEQGVADGILAESAAVVPKGNLAAMHRALGKLKSIDGSARPRTQVAGRPGRSTSSNRR